MAFRFENLEIWKMAIEYGEMIYALVKKSLGPSFSGSLLILIGPVFQFPPTLPKVLEAIVKRNSDGISELLLNRYSKGFHK